MAQYLPRRHNVIPEIFFNHFTALQLILRLYTETVFTKFYDRAVSSVSCYVSHKINKLHVQYSSASDLVHKLPPLRACFVYITVYMQTLLKFYSKHRYLLILHMYYNIYITRLGFIPDWSHRLGVFP